MPIIIWGISIVNASDTSCWSTYWWTPPTTTYASWIVYWCDSDIPIITIYWQNSDWADVWITIKAMNEWTWTIKIWNWEDSYWSYYQWWNDYPFSWEITNVSGSAVYASGYWPDTHYNSGVWIKQYKWDTSDNGNLRWWSWDEKRTNNMWWFDTSSFAAVNVGNRKWMCDEGYHIPSQWERNALLHLWATNSNPNNNGTSLNSLSYLSEASAWTNFSQDLLIPFAGNRYCNDGKVYSTGSTAYYWSSSPDYDEISSRSFYFYADYLLANYNSYRGIGLSVRCFKDSYVKLPKTLNLFFMSSTGDVQEVWTWEVTENMTGVVPEKAKNVTKTWYELLWWTRSGATETEIFDFETTPISWAWADESGNVYFIAQWTGIKYEIKFEAWDWTWTMENQTFTYDVTWTLDRNAFTKNWYTFSGWTDKDTWSWYTDGQEVINLTTTSEEVIILTAQWTKIETKPSWGSSGGGGRSSRTSDTQDSSTSSQNDKKTENVIQSDPEHSEWGSEESSKTPMDSSTSSQNDGKSYTQEFQEAYEFAKEKWITTMPTIQKADMDGKLTRIAMAKMLSQYAMNVLWQKPANIVTPKFNDVTDKQNSDYDDWVTLAYQLWIMWQNMPNNKFRPNDEVTRAEFATALSRMLYHTSDWEYKSTDKYYTNHMKKLVQEKIITNDDAKMKELRWYVMIMLMRSAK